jgi:integrase
MPANRDKLYKGLPLDEAIARSEAEQKPRLAPFTQERYLASFSEILDLAAKKRLITVNPAADLKPIKRDTVAASAKRLSFTPEQLKQFFDCKYYRNCALHPPAYTHAKPAWRFWLPLLCLFMGLRPNEACQINTDDVKCTAKGTWYLDLVASDDDDAPGAGKKTLKTASSHRKVPIHPELIKIGFLNFAKEQKKTPGSRLLPDLKPDEYGNHASYALKRFRDSFLPQAIKIGPRQTFYSFRHNFRDALRRIEAPPDALQALGGWSQGKLTSDSYGDKSDPDYQVKFMNQVAPPCERSAPARYASVRSGVGPTMRSSKASATPPLRLPTAYLLHPRPPKNVPPPQVRDFYGTSCGSEELRMWPICGKRRGRSIAFAISKL